MGLIKTMLYIFTLSLRKLEKHVGKTIRNHRKLPTTTKVMPHGSRLLPPLDHSASELTNITPPETGNHC